MVGQKKTNYFLSVGLKKFNYGTGPENFWPDHKIVVAYLAYETINFDEADKFQCCKQCGCRLASGTKATREGYYQAGKCYCYTMTRKIKLS